MKKTQGPSDCLAFGVTTLGMTVNLLMMDELDTEAKHIGLKHFC